MKQNMSYYLKMFGFFVMLTYGEHTQTMNVSSLKKIVKNTVMLYGCYVLFKEVSYHYAVFAYTSAIKQKNDLTSKLLYCHTMPNPTFQECAEREQRLQTLRETMQTKKNQTLISKYLA